MTQSVQASGVQAPGGSFKTRVHLALHDVHLQDALARTREGFVDKRREVVEQLPEFESLKSIAREIKEHTLSHLDFYLQRFEQNVQKRGGHVHWAQTPAQAQQMIVEICAQAGAKKIIKGKSMVSEEMEINGALQQNGFEVLETDLGEYILQLAGEIPSHIIAPAIHKTKAQVSDLFYANHKQHGMHERLTDREDLVNQARQVLRKAFVSADVGITGANFLVAETGSHVLVTNEGNGDLSSILPRVHIVTAGIEKLVPTLDDLMVILRLLARSATGQEKEAYNSIYSGPKRDDDLDGPQEYHVVLLDNGRSDMLGNEFREMLRCIRCGACLNHCPVWGSVGGHAYGWIYSGPMGAVLTPLMQGLDKSRDLPNACTLNGRCQEVCPMQIPLPRMLRSLRVRDFEQKLGNARARWMLRLWAWLAKKPWLYRVLMNTSMRVLKFAARKNGALSWLPFGSGWTATRDFPAPEGESFQTQWRKQRG